MDTKANERDRMLEMLRRQSELLHAQDCHGLANEADRLLAEISDCVCHNSINHELACKIAAKLHFLGWLPNLHSSDESLLTVHKLIIEELEADNA